MDVGEKQAVGSKESYPKSIGSTGIKGGGSQTKKECTMVPKKMKKESAQDKGE